MSITLSLAISWVLSLSVADVLAFNVASWPASLLGAVINNMSMPAFSRVKHDPNLLNQRNGQCCTRGFTHRNANVRADDSTSTPTRSDFVRSEMGRVSNCSFRSFSIWCNLYYLRLVRK